VTVAQRGDDRFVLQRFLYDEDGRARPRRMIVVFAIAIGFALFGTFLLVLAPVFNGHEGFQTLWVVFSVILLKLPLVSLLWWFIVRNKELPGRAPKWSDTETREILAYLMAEADRVQGFPDAPARLAYLQREAWNVADKVGGEVKVDAVDTALHIDHMIPRQRTPRSPGS
jgi:hypothetical protein